MAMSFPLTLGTMDEKIAVLIAGAMGACLVMYIVRSIRKVRETRELEQTKREIAAYVAEGSIAPDDAVKLLNSGKAEGAESVIADGVAWGTISAAKAERLIRTLRTQNNQGPQIPPVSATS